MHPYYRHCRKKFWEHICSSFIRLLFSSTWRKNVYTTMEKIAIRKHIIFILKCNRITGWSYPKSVISSTKKKKRNGNCSHIAIRRSMKWMRTVTHKRNQYEEFLIHFTYPRMNSRDLARCRSWFHVNPLHQAAFR